MNKNRINPRVKFVRKRFEVFFWANIVAFPLFLICLFFAIRWSSYPIGQWPFGLEYLFISSSLVDSSMLNLATGYVSGYIVYILTTLLPIYVKNKKMENNAAENHLLPIYRQAVYVLLLMCKNSSTKEQWEKIVKSNDLDCFNEHFYKSMEVFDLKSEADTMLLYKDTKKPIKWYEYLKMFCESIDKELDATLSQYQSYLTDGMIKSVIGLRTSQFIEMFLGRSTSYWALFTDKNGHQYCEALPIGNIYEGQESLRPVFSKNEAVSNHKILVDFVSCLQALYPFLAKHTKGLEVRNDFAISKLREEKIGRLGISIFTYPTHPVMIQPKQNLGNSKKVKSGQCKNKSKKRKR